MNRIQWVWVLVAVFAGAIIGWIALRLAPADIPAQDVVQGSGEVAPPSEEKVSPATVIEEGKEGGPSEEPHLETPLVEKATIRQLLDNWDQYQGAPVLVEGKVATQCVVSGCWFTLDDGTGVILVELIGEALDNPIPRGSIGRAVQVRGKFFFAPRPRLVLERPEDWSFR